MQNIIHLIGRLGKDAETTATFTRFSLATSESWKDKATGEWQERTEWHRVIAWNYTKEIPKGALVAVTGKVTYTQHEGKWYTDIVARSVRVLTGGAPAHRDGAPAEALAPAPPAPTGPEAPDAQPWPAHAPVQQQPGSGVNVDDDLPF